MDLTTSQFQEMLFYHFFHYNAVSIHTESIERRVLDTNAGKQQS
jgi:hypothetical protein